MVKTTIILEDELYKRLVEEAIERYGSTRKLSLVINQRLKESFFGKKEKKRWPTVKIGKELTPEMIEELIVKGWRNVIKWKC